MEWSGKWIKPSQEMGEVCPVFIRELIILSVMGDYANLKDSEDSWLAQDDAYLAARLRDSFAADGGNIQSGSSKAVYSGDDLTFAGVYAKSLSQQIKNAGHVWEVWRPCESDSELGKFLVKQYQDTRQINWNRKCNTKLCAFSTFNCKCSS